MQEHAKDTRTITTSVANGLESVVRTTNILCALNRLPLVRTRFLRNNFEKIIINIFTVCPSTGGLYWNTGYRDETSPSKKLHGNTNAIC